MLDALVEPFRYGFFQHAIVVATVTGALCGLIGMYVVLRGMSYIGHGLSHAIFGGAVASSLLGINVFIGAGAWGLLAALFINKVTRRRTIGADAAIGAITTASFAIGIILISVQRQFVVNFEALLWGNVLGVSTADVWVVVVVALASAAFVFGFYRQLLFSTFDPDVAEVSGVRTGLVDLLLAVTLSATIAATMNVIGVTMIAALLVIPPVVGRLLSDSFVRMLWISVAVGTVCGFAGVYGSYYLDWSSGGTVVLAAAIMFVAAFAWSELRGRRLALGVAGA